MILQILLKMYSNFMQLTALLGSRSLFPDSWFHPILFWSLRFYSKFRCSYLEGHCIGTIKASK